MIKTHPFASRTLLRRVVRARALIWIGTLGVLGSFVAGCAQNEIGRVNWLPWVISKPQQIQRIRNPIVKSENYWIQREIQPEEQFPGPTPDDLKRPEKDYILGSGDLIDITVFELITPGQPYIVRQRITQSGNLTMRYLGSVKCAGLTARGLEEKLSDMLEPDYIIDPQVNVFVMEYRNLAVSVLNGVFRPGRYPLLEQDMTLLELLAQAGGVVQIVEDYGYVVREYSPEEADMVMLELAPAAAEAEEGAAPPEEVPPPAEPGTEKAPEEGVERAPEGEPAAEAPARVPEAAEHAAEADQEVRDLLQKMAEGEMPEVKRIEEAEAAAAEERPPAANAEEAVPPEVAEALAEEEGELGRWVWSDGKWVEVKPKVEEAVPAVPEVPEVPEAPEEVEEVEVAVAEEEAIPSAEESRLALESKLRREGVVQGAGQLKRIIRFDVEALQAGDPTQNLVLRDGDVITIPSPPIGDFYMTGYVARPGVYSLTGRKITLLQAVAAAGGLTAVAVPWRTEVVRRISETEEEIIYVDVAKIARGESPDFYVQPEDLIRVGTDQGAIFNAVLRNAFRATYGLGAVYDTNFANFYPWTDSLHPIFETFF
ncbi:MAG TPA: polysaccharide biosynthesis/export family protein [Phycisphaerae bacterium]|nr:polysaccharide biosynthesis/export family protein [Phycisphaerae bacterium]